MYLPKHFEQHDRQALIGLMRERPLATLITTTPSGPSADLIPLELVANEGEHGMLRGHVARANPLWQRAGTMALAVFTGPEAYISPGWYASKKEHGKVVPTWNYTMVQACGVLHAVEEAPWLHALVNRLTDHHEAAQAKPWHVSDAPDDYVQQMLRAIVGIENRSAADREGTARGLSQADAEMAALVRWTTRAR
jgi:transcriptional regulator